MTDSQTVFHWLTDTLSGKARVKTKAATEMLIRRRLETVKEITREYGLSLNVKFVHSAANKADALTRVPKKWLNQENNSLTCGATTLPSEKDIFKSMKPSGIQTLSAPYTFAEECTLRFKGGKCKVLLELVMHANPLTQLQRDGRKES